MKKKWAIKKTDETPSLNIIDGLTGWIQKNRERVLYIVLTSAAVLILIIYFTIRQKNINEKSWGKFADIQQKITQAENFDAQKNYFVEIDELVKKYPGRPASAYALMFKGEILYENGNYEKSADAYQQIIKNKGLKKYIPFAINSLLYCYLAQNKEDDFLKTAEGFVKKYPNHFLTPQVYANMADIYQSKGETVKLQEIYQKLASDFETSPWGVSAGTILKQKISEQSTQGKTPSEK